MKKIIHIEDSFDWQMRVAETLRPIQDANLTSFVSFEEVMDGVLKGQPLADLYILDRHICEKPSDYGPNDESWRKFLNVVKSLSQPNERRVVMLSHHVPRDISNRLRYPGILDAVPKQAFDPGYFRQKIEHYLGLNGKTGARK